MLLSVFVYNHKLAPGQWAGAGVVFAGISVEAWVKRQGESNSHVSVYSVDPDPQMFTQSGLLGRKKRQNSSLYRFPMAPKIQIMIRLTKSRSKVRPRTRVRTELREYNGRETVMIP